MKNILSFEIQKLKSKIKIISSQTESLIDLKTSLVISYFKNNEINFFQVYLNNSLWKKQIAKFLFENQNIEIVDAYLEIKNHFQNRSFIEIREQIPKEKVQEIFNQVKPEFYELVWKQKEKELELKIESISSMIEQIKRAYENLGNLEFELKFLINKLTELKKEKEEFFKKPI